MDDREQLKKKIKEAAKAFDIVFEDAKITDVKVRNDRVLFYKGDELLFDFSKEEILNNDY